MKTATERNIVDIHTHILFGVDDGASDLEQSRRMLVKAKEAGVTDICMTPHIFITDGHDNTGREKKMDKLKGLSVGITLHTGGEVMAENTIAEFIGQHPEFCLGEGRYVLLEMPMFNYPMYMRQALYELRLKGFIPIVAHPERNAMVQRMKKKDCCREILENGYLQINAGSITGQYGRKVKKTAKSLIKQGLVTFVASDAHNTKAYENLAKAYGIYAKLKGGEEADRVFNINPGKALKGEFI